MPIKQLNLQCAVDNEITPHNQPAPNHVLHAVLTLFMLGLWVIVWIPIAMGAGKAPATCVKCGNQRMPLGPATVYKTPEYAGLSKRGLLIMLGIIVTVIVGFMIWDAVSPDSYGK